MSRIRTLKPSFGLHEDLSQLPPETHLLAAVLLMYADDEGFFRAHPGLVQSQCLPLRTDDVGIPESLELLQGIGYVTLGTGADGKRYGRVTNFLKHQRINRPSPSLISGLAIDWDLSPNQKTSITESSLTEGNGTETGSEKELNGTTQSGSCSRQEQKDPGLLAAHPNRVPAKPSLANTAPGPTNTATAYPPEFLNAWEQYPRRAGANPKNAALHAWQARIAEGFLPDEILAGVRRYAAFVRQTGKAGSEFVMQAKTFLGPEHHFLNPFDPPRSPDAGKTGENLPGDYQDGVDSSGEF